MNVSQPGIQFKLTGPDGWIGFSNLTSDSALINLPTSGGYTLSALAPVANTAAITRFDSSKPCRPTWP